ncbi:MAG TPA: hypothetical protein VME24_01480 [Alphaproteobacteria bacterium]|nr:hypothetical protein [Alphaproteobacteria bacterium]
MVENERRTNGVMIALTYGPTGSVIYLDGQLAATGDGVRYVPGGDILTNGFSIC